MCLFVCGDYESALKICRTHRWQAQWAVDITGALAESLQGGDATRALALARKAVSGAGAPYDAAAIFLMLLTLGEVFPVLGLNSKLSLICVYLGGALGVNTFLMYGFFNTIPMEIDESAKIDGATHAQIFWRLIMPLVTPILAVVGLLAFIAAFGDYIIAKIVLVSEDNWTLAVGMFQWVSNQLASNWGLFAAGAILASVPVLALFLSLQRYIVGGLTAGSVKG